MKLAAQDLIKGLPERRTCQEQGQGIFLLEDPVRPGEFALYVNNGQRVYKGIFVTPEAQTVQWIELEGPGDGGYIFRPRNEPWSVEITSVQDLIQGNSITMAEIREAVFTLERLISANFSFVYQNTDPTFLAFHLFASAVHCAFKTKVITAFTGDYHSGKSTALSLFSGVTNPQLQLLECTMVAANFSPAALYQGLDRSTQNLALDEFEDEGDKNNTQKARAVADVSEMLRTIIGESGARIVRGTNASDGHGREYVLHTNVFLASILRAQKAQDESRRFDIEMKKDENKKDPAQTLFSMISREEWLRIRRIITLGMPKLVLALGRAYDMIRDTVSNTKVIPFNVPIRYVSGMYQAAALMHLLG
jgi:energy-coupling factor transporter ATP-binding protein EcfA2